MSLVAFDSLDAMSTFFGIIMEALDKLDQAELMAVIGTVLDQYCADTETPPEEINDALRSLAEVREGVIFTIGLPDPRC